MLSRPGSRRRIQLRSTGPADNSIIELRHYIHPRVMMGEKAADMILNTWDRTAFRLLKPASFVFFLFPFRFLGSTYQEAKA